MSNIKLKDLTPIKDRFINLTSSKEFHKEASFALQAIYKNKQLQKADKQSILEAVMNIAQTGLTLNPIHNFAYLVPRYDRSRGVVCQLMPSYQGLIKLLTDNGSVTSAYSHVVYENDEFSYSLGLNPDLVHKPTLKNKGELVAAYAIGITKEGDKQVEVMSAEELYIVRDMSESWKAFKAGKINSCVWADWEGEMCRKTVIKRLAKYLPKTNQFESVSKAIDLDNQEYKIDPNGAQASYILRLLMTCTLGEEEESEIERKVLTGSYSQSEVSEVINKLKDSQIDAIDAGNNYGQKAIHEKLDKIEGKK